LRDSDTRVTVTLAADSQLSLAVVEAHVCWVVTSLEDHGGRRWVDLAVRL